MTYLPARVDHLKRGLGGDVVVDRGDAAVLDRDVQLALALSARVDHLAAADQQVEAHRLPPRRRPLVDYLRHASTAARIQSSASRRTNP